MLSKMLKQMRWHNIDNCEFYVGDMKVVFNDALLCNTDNLMSLSLIHQETEQRRDWTNHENCPAKVVYVSCNSATQARDLALMDEKYKVTRVRPRYVSANASRRKCSSS
jgi:23S rRNA (uracil1939-C5)-methyltransferase